MFFYGISYTTSPTTNFRTVNKTKNLLNFLNVAPLIRFDSVLVKLPDDVMHPALTHYMKQFVGGSSLYWISPGFKTKCILVNDIYVQDSLLLSVACY